MSRAKSVVSFVVACLAGSLFAGLGGTEISSTVYVSQDTDFGEGDITLATSGALLVNQTGPSVTVPNKIIFKGQNQLYTYVSSTDHDRSIRLISVGTPADAATHHIRLGRASAAGLGWVTLSLTDPLSEALDEIRLAGTLKLTLDGGTVKARSDAKTPFFKQADAAGAVSVDVTTNGVAFDVAEGACITPAHPLLVVTAWHHEEREVVAETYYPDNWSFEAYSGYPLAQPGYKEGDWVDDPHPNGHGEYSEVSDNNSAHDVSGDVVWSTTNGTRYAVVRRGDSMKRTISLPAAGDWRVVFELGCRPGANAYSVNQVSTVKVDDTLMLTVPGVTAANRHGFQQFVTPKFHFEAGEHVIRLSVEDSNQGSGSMNFDAVRLERIVVETIVDEPVITPIAKLGAGELVLADQGLPRTRLTAVAGKLTLSNLDYGDHSAVEADAGATLCLAGAQQNLIRNGNFEFDGPYDYENRSICGWTAECLDPVVRDKTKDGWGLQTNGGTVTRSGPLTPCGRTTAFLRPLNKLSQTVNVTKAGKYVFSFLSADRPYADSYKIPFSAAVDGQTVISEPATSAYRDYRRFSATVDLDAGEHVIAITADDSDSPAGSVMIFVDDVSLVEEEAATLAPEFRLKSGATLELDNSNPLYIRDFYVDGVRVNGGRTALRSAGLTVTGSGKLSVGDKLGMLMIFR